jgi:hypothetical protein
MFNSTSVVIDAFSARLAEAYVRNYGSHEHRYGEILEWAGRMALERIAESDALYHNVDHTIHVTLVGQEMLRGKHFSEGGVSPEEWLHFTISLLCHDIGYVRGTCRADDGRDCATGEDGARVTVPPGATDAFLTPWHIDRGKTFIRERFGSHRLIDAERIARNIELTRFPVPDAADHQDTAGYPGLVRAADLIGQLADPGHLRRLPALFSEFEETGTNQRLGYETPQDLRRDYPDFFWKHVTPYIREGLAHLKVTEQGRQWVANLHAHVFTTEHE